MLFQPMPLKFKTHNKPDLKRMECYSVSILVNGRFFKDQIALVRKERYGSRPIELVNNGKDETTIYFNQPQFYQGVVQTVDIIIRDANGKAIDAFLDVELVDESHREEPI